MVLETNTRYKLAIVFNLAENQSDDSENGDGGTLEIDEMLDWQVD